MLTASRSTTSLSPCPRCGAAFAVYAARDRYGRYESCLFCGLTIEQERVLPGEIFSKRKGFELG